MPDYQLFGGTIRSAIDFPELVPVAAGSPHWHLAQLATPTSHDSLVPLGTEEVGAGVMVSLFRAGSALRLVFDDTGTFDISSDGRRIDWAPPAAPDMEAVRKDVLGRVLAVALEQEGIITLHGSAVALGGTAVVFLAPKFHGKSTTATALVDAGGHFLADDIVPVTPGADPMVLPGVPFVQLWPDSAEHVAGSAAQASPDQNSPKLQVAWAGSERHAAAAVPLGAVYLLAPVRSEEIRRVRRERVTGVVAALALLGQAKVGGLLGVERRAVLLQHLVDLSERVPVYRLEIPRDFDRISELTSSLLEWHAGASAANPIGGPS